MPEVRGDDERAHFTEEEREALAAEIVALIRSRLTAGQGNAPGCRQCVANVAALAFVEIIEEAKQTEHMGEALGIAKLAVTTRRYLASATQRLADRAVDLVGKRESGLFDLLSITMGGREDA